MTRLRATVAALAAAALVAGCGGDEEAAPVEQQPQTELESQSAEAIRECLVDAGFKVVAGERSPNDRDAPDVELSMFVAGSPVFIAVYDDPGRAERYASELERNARRLGGTYTLRGGVGVLVAGEQPPEHRKPIEACAFS